MVAMQPSSINAGLGIHFVKTENMSASAWGGFQGGKTATGVLASSEGRTSSILRNNKNGAAEGPTFQQDHASQVVAPSLMPLVSCVCSTGL